MQPYAASSGQYIANVLSLVKIDFYGNNFISPLQLTLAASKNLMEQAIIERKQTNTNNKQVTCKNKNMYERVKQGRNNSPKITYI